MGLTKGSRRPAAEIFFADLSGAVTAAAFCDTFSSCFFATIGVFGAAGLGATATTGLPFLAVPGFGANGPLLDALVFGFACGATATTGVLAGADFAGVAPVLAAEVLAPDFCCGFTTTTGWLFWAPALLCAFPPAAAGF